MERRLGSLGEQLEHLVVSNRTAHFMDDSDATTIWDAAMTLQRLGRRENEQLLEGKADADERDAKGGQ